jgi:SAM-dependent methyltransferase
MKNIELWHPTKFVYRNGKLQASRNPKEVSISSRFVVNLVANHYELYLKDHVTGDLIDLGCGKVPLYDAYKSHTTSCTCADWESTLHKNPYLDLTADLNKPLPFPSEKFDTIILSDVLEHIAKPDDLWREMYRILKPGGKLILNVPFFYKLHEVPHDYFRYTKYALQNFADSSGLKLILLKEIGGLPEVLIDLTGKFFYNIPIIGKILSRLLQEIGNFFSRTHFGKKLTAKTKDQYPLGYFMIVSK